MSARLFHCSILMCLTLTAVAIAPSATHAQEAAGVVDARLALQPVLADWTETGYHAPTPAQDWGRTRSDLVMMTVGGTGLVLGLVIGGDEGMVIASTGGVIALIGLYRYLR